jgi:hypothetical protein
MKKSLHNDQFKRPSPKMRKFILPFFLATLIAAAIFLRDGPLGPPIYTDAVGGNYIITAPVWFASEDDVSDHASIACLNRYFNSSVVKIVMHPMTYHSVGEWFDIPVLPQWVSIYCSP